MIDRKPEIRPKIGLRQVVEQGFSSFFPQIFGINMTIFQRAFDALHFEKSSKVPIIGQKIKKNLKPIYSGHF